MCILTLLQSRVITAEVILQPFTISDSSASLVVLRPSQFLSLLNMLVQTQHLDDAFFTLHPVCRRDLKTCFGFMCCL